MAWRDLWFGLTEANEHFARLAAVSMTSNPLATGPEAGGGSRRDHRLAEILERLAGPGGLERLLAIEARWV